MRSSFVVGAVALLALSGTLLLPLQPAGAQAGPADPRPPNATGQTPAFPGQTDVPEQKLNVAFDIVTVTDSLQNPWGLAFLPGGKLLVTERPGRLRIITPDGKKSEPVTGLPPVDARGQGGLLDIALDPNFTSNRLIYWSFAEPQEGGANNTAVARGRLVEGDAPRVEDVQVIYHQTPALQSRGHFGSRLVFGRDGTLFITQGDRQTGEGRTHARRLDGTVGKVVRINADGSIPRDNPFVGRSDVKPEIWSLGHRNSQGATLHPTTGELWEIEHGTRGGDEINIPRKGKDYGWPNVAYGIEYQGGPILEGMTQLPGTEQPVYYWDPVIAPSGMAFYTGNLFPAWRGSLFIGGHVNNELVRLSLNGEKVVGEERLLTDLPERIKVRDVRQGPDGALYLLHDNANGKIVKLVPRR